MPLEDFQFTEPVNDGMKPFLLPGAEALIPVNPGRWPAHAVATAFTSDVGLIENPQLQMIDNVETTLAYLSTASSLHETIDRTQKVMFDVGVISALHEVCPTAGAIVAGDYANQCADYYNEEACSSRANPRLEDDLSYILRNQKSILQENLEGEEITDSFELKLRGPGKSANIPQADRKSVMRV